MSIEAMKQALGALDAYMNASDSQEDARAHTMLSVAAGMLRAAIVEAERQPAQRQWVGLTDEERRSIREWQKIQEELGPVWAPMMLYLYMAIEAKLKEKNT